MLSIAIFPVSLQGQVTSSPLICLPLPVFNTHTFINVPGIVDLLESLNPSRQSQIHGAHQPSFSHAHHARRLQSKQGSFLGHTKAQPELFTSRNAFENYAKGRENFSIQALLTIFAYNTMHEDICNLAEEKCINLIIIPFHMQANIDRAMEDANPSLKGINNNVIQKALYSVAVFVHHRLSMPHMIESYKYAS